MPAGSRTRYFEVPIANSSNYNVLQQRGTLYSITGSWPAGSIARVDDTHRLNGVLDINASAASNTVGHFASNTNFTGLAFEAGVTIAVSSNARVTLEIAPA